MSFMCLPIVAGKKGLPPIFLKLMGSGTLELNEGKADNGSISFTDPDAALFDSQVFVKDTVFVLMMGDTSDLQAIGPLTVKGTTMVFPENSSPVMTVEFQDRSHVMNKRQKQKKWTGTPASIIKSIAKNHGLGWDIDDIAGIEFSDDFPIMQAAVTDARFMQMLSNRYGYVWGVDGQNLYFKRPESTVEAGRQKTEDTPVLNYRVGDMSLLSFSPSIKVVQNGRVKGRGVSQAGVSEINDEAAAEGAEEGDAEEPGIMNTLMGLFGAGGSEKSPEVDKLLKAAGMTPEGKENGLVTPKAKPTGEKGGPSGEITIDSITASIKVLLDTAKPEGAEKVDPGNTGGAASASNMEEIKRRAEAALLGASEIIEADIVPTKGSMKWRPKMEVIVNGVGVRLSTNYRVTQVVQTWGNDIQLKTVLKAKARREYSDSRVKKRIADATQVIKTIDKAEVSLAIKKKMIEVNSVRGKVSLVDSKESL